MSLRLRAGTNEEELSDYSEALGILGPEDQARVVAAIELAFPIPADLNAEVSLALARLVTWKTPLSPESLLPAARSVVRAEPLLFIADPVATRRLEFLQRLRSLAAREAAEETVVMDSKALAAISRSEGLWHPREWGRFENLQPVGGGGFGWVYRAWDTQLLRDVALKLLRPVGDSTEENQAAALHEARMMARVRHPNIVPVYGVETHDGRVGFWSEFIEGSTLSAIVRESGPLPPREGAGIVAELCRATAAVHTAGMLHRDIKADNAIRETGGNRILLMDFGLSHESGAGRELGGTPQYMAPELFLGGEPSVASDVYALGALLHFLASGAFPVQGTLRELRAAADQGTHRSLSAIRPDLAAPFLAVVDRATAIRPEERFATPEAMLQALEDFLAGERVETGPPVATRSKFSFPVVAVAVAVLGLALFVYWKMYAGNGTRGGANELYRQAHAFLLRRDQSGNVARAISLYERTIQRDPKFALAWAELADAQWEEFRRTTEVRYRDLALSNAEKALALDKDLAPVYVVLGRIHNGTGQRSLAMQNFGRARQLDPRNADLYRELAQVYDAEGRSSEAETALQKALDLNPNDWRNPNSLALHFLAAGKLREAAEQLTKALEATPDNPRVWSNFGVVRARQNQLPAAREAYEKALRFAPDNYAALVALGSLHEQLGDFEQAAASYEKAVKINPSNYLTWANLASAWQWGKGGMERALPAYQKAIDLAEGLRKVTPTDAELLARLGSYYASLGEKKKSLPILRQALALDPENPNVQGRVGEGYEILGQREQALPLVMRALERGFSADLVRLSPDFSKLRADPRFRFPPPQGR